MCDSKEKSQTENNIVVMIRPRKFSVCVVNKLVIKAEKIVNSHNGEIEYVVGVNVNVVDVLDVLQMLSPVICPLPIKGESGCPNPLVAQTLRTE